MTTRKLTSCFATRRDSDRPGRTAAIVRRAALLGCLLLASAVRLHDLGDKALWLDEIVQTNLALQAGSLGQLLDSVASDPVDTTPPLFHTVQYASLHFGETEFFARLPSAIFGILTVIVLYFATTRWLGWHIGLLSALFLSVSSFHVYYSQEARPYSAFSLFALLSFVFFHERFVRRNGGHATTFLFVLSSVLMCYSHFFGLLVVASQCGGLLVVSLLRQGMRKSISTTLRSLVMPLSCISIVILPVLRLLNEKNSARGSVSLPGPELTFGLVSDSLSELSGTESTLLVLVSVLIVLGAVSKLPGDRVIRQLSLCCSLVFFALAIVTLKLAHSFFHPRYLMPILPFLMLLLGSGIARVAELIRYRRLRTLALIGITLLPVVANVALLTRYYETDKRPWRSVVRHLEDRVHRGDIVLVEPAYLRYSLLYYLGVRDLYAFPTNTLVGEQSVSIGPAVMLANAAEISRHRRIWYLVDRGGMDLNQKDSELPSWVLRSHRLSATFPGTVGNLDVYVNDNPEANPGNGKPAADDPR